METITKQQFKKRFAQTKLFADCKTKEIVEQLTKAGIKRGGSDSSYRKDEEMPFIYLKLFRGFVSYSFGDNMEKFANSDCRIVTAEDMLDVDIVEDEVLFNFKDEVVARNGNSVWFYGVISSVLKERIADLYILAGGNTADKCLPYNENTAKLIGTFDDYKEE